MSSQNDGSATSHTGEIMSLAFAFCICVILFVAVCVICSRHQGRVSAARTTADAITARLEQPLHTIVAAPGGGLGKAEIATLPTFAYRCPVESVGGSCSRAGDAAAQCVVCLTAMADGEKVRMLPGCRHVFHVGCVDMWLLSHSTCPVCRADAKLPLPLPPPPHKFTSLTAGH